MSDVAFRSGVTTPAAAAPEAAGTEKTVETPAGGKSDLAPTLYSEEKGVPYAAEYLESASIYPNLDTDTVGNLGTIDEYFKQCVHEGRYVNDAVGYREYMRMLERVTDTKGAPLRSKVGQIAEYVKYVQRRAKYGNRS